MENRNCEQLFEYLRSILYDTKVQPLDLEKLDEPYQKLGMGLQYLDKMIQEMKAYSAALSRGSVVMSSALYFRTARCRLQRISCR